MDIQTTIDHHDFILTEAAVIESLRRSGDVDFLLGATLPAVSEATGIAIAMAETNIPYIISFVINREGKILDGNSLRARVKITSHFYVPMHPAWRCCQSAKIS
jgi:S-methylmethionine-dependent homocysteine/selenocysteine methylase